MAPFELLTASSGLSLASGEEGMALALPEAWEGEPLVMRAASSGRLHITVAPRAKVSLVLELEGNQASANVVVSLNVGEEAVCEFTLLQELDAAGTCTILQEASVGAGAALRSRHVSVGSLKSVHDVNVTLKGHDARSDIDWISYAKGEEDHHLRATNWFDAPGGMGEILMKSVVEQQANVREHGKIGIGLDGRGTNSYLTQEVLMLDASAKVDAVPALEIKTNDVKASHSATVARVTAEDLFYFASRGIAERDARRMYVLGFLGAVLGRVEDTALRERIAASVEAKYDA